MLALEARTRLGALELDVALAVGVGECLALAGPSGAGKTSLLRTVAGLFEPTKGRVSCDGEHWLDTGRGISVPPDQRRVGYLFQDHALFPNMTVWRNVAFGMGRVPRRDRRKRAQALLDRFGMGSHANEWPRTLSGGERQRVALARALARKPSALLLDEPLSALDVRTRAEAGRQLATVLADVPAPAILVTHDFGEAALLADRVAVIDAGQIVQVGSAAVLAGKPQSAFVADLTGAVVLNGLARTGAHGLTEIDLDGGGLVWSTDPGRGRVAVTVHPWEVSVEPRGSDPHGSTQNRLAVTVASVTPLGNRVRVGMMAGQALTADLTASAARQLELAPGMKAVASWKATATRVVAR